VRYNTLMNTSTNSAALLYDNDGYVETPGQPIQTGNPVRTGLIGRQVAGKEFLDAYLTHGTWTTLVALIRNQSSADTLVRYFQGHPSQRGRQRGLLLVREQDFLRAFFPKPPSGILYNPCPPDLRYAWARHHKGTAAFALSGVTHTLCSQRAIEWLGDLVTAPFEPYDSLICTSTAVLKMVRAVTGSYADYLRERMGGTPRVRMRLEVIPLGVDTDKFRPATPEERAQSRATLQIAPDEVVVLFVGRLSHHTKAHPFPLYHVVSHAARATSHKVHVVMSGWAHNQAVMQAFQDGARTFAANVRVSFVDGTEPRARVAVWRAADVFASLSDNIQETFGLVIIEAMASGLPVVATDWDGYRDLVADGETGWLVPTLMLPGATTDTTIQMQLEAIDYDHFLAQCSQAVTVDCARATEAFTRLISDAALRRRQGEAGRRRALERFAWANVIRAYETLWREQEQERQRYLRGAPSPHAQNTIMARHPPPEHAFACYPSRWLHEDDRLLATEGALDRLGVVLASPLANHVANTRASDPTLLRAVLSAADGKWLCDVEKVMSRAGVEQTVARATLAWLLKYDLLRVTSSAERAPPAAS
jgi:glycosyltransferase involved in cell wall biosynthesis